MDNSNVMRLDLHIADASEKSIFQGATEVLKTLRPQWQSSDIICRMLTDGITNKLVRCKLKDAADKEAVLIRIYGNKTDMLIDRKAETRNIQMLNKYHLAPNLYATFTNGLAYEYVPGCTLSKSSVRTAEIYGLVARHMAKLHKVQPSSASTTNGFSAKIPAVWSKLERFLQLVPDEFTNECVQKRFLMLQMTKAQLITEVALLKARLSRINSPIVFCHNDLLLGNVIHTQDTDAVTFIDFEYADWNYQAFDIGNHFQEFAGIDDVDYDKDYPSKELQMAWLREYASEYYEVKAEEVDEEVVRRLYAHANQFALAAHLLWGVWALIQAEHSSIDFDFIQFATVHLNEYFRRKEEFLALPA